MRLGKSVADGLNLTIEHKSMARYSAVLDACVIVPIALADTLLRVAESGLYRPLWSSRIIAEALEAILMIHPEMNGEKISGRFQDMNITFEDACVEGRQDLELIVKLPDDDDRHVVSTAICGRADVIVTFNLKDYPHDALEAFNLDVIHPDYFLLNQLDLAPKNIVEVIREQASHARYPKLDPVDLLARLAKAGVPQFAQEVLRLI
jgi:predicted nucleic acid-binding protein